MIVVSEELISFTDVFVLVKLLQQSQYNRPVYILVNMVKDFTMSIEVYKRFKAITRKHLNTEVHYLGYVPRDEAVSKAVLAQKPVITYAPDSPASRNFVTVAHAISRHLLPSAEDYDFVQYWNKILKRNQHNKQQDTEIKNKEVTADKDTSIEKLISTLVQHLRKNRLPLKYLELLTHSLLDTSLGQYKTLPFDIKHYLYRHLKSNLFNEDELHKLIMSLIALYEKQHEQSFARSDTQEKKLATDNTDAHDTNNESNILELPKHFSKHHYTN